MIADEHYCNGGGEAGKISDKNDEISLNKGFINKKGLQQLTQNQNENQFLENQTRNGKQK